MIKKDYPIMPTVEEVSEYTAANMNALTQAEQRDLMQTAAAQVYSLLYGLGKKEIKKRILERYAQQLENPVKAAIARQVNYLLINGDIGAFNGVTRSSDGSSVSVTPSENIEKNIIGKEVIAELKESDVDILYFGEEE